MPMKKTLRVRDAILKRKIFEVRSGVIPGKPLVYPATSTCQQCTAYRAGTSIELPHLILYSRVRIFLCRKCLREAFEISTQAEP